MIVLPAGAKVAVNVNTAPAEVLSALVPGLSLSDAAAVVSARKTSFYLDQSGFTRQQQVTGKPIKALWGVRSDYFLAYSRVKLDRATLETQSLLQRGRGVPTRVLWIREY